jgi:hypothetical protein
MNNHFLDLLGTSKPVLEGAVYSNLLNVAIKKVKDNWVPTEYQYFNVEIHKLNLVIWCQATKLEEAKQLITKLGNSTNSEYLAYNRDHYHFGNKCKEARIKASKLSIPGESIGFNFPTDEVLWIDNTNQWLWFMGGDKKLKSLVKGLVN